MRTAEVVVIGRASTTPRPPVGKAFANWFLEGKSGDRRFAFLTPDRFVQRLISSEPATLYGPNDRHRETLIHRSQPRGR